MSRSCDTVELEAADEDLRNKAVHWTRVHDETYPYAFEDKRVTEEDRHENLTARDLLRQAAVAFVIAEIETQFAGETPSAAEILEHLTKKTNPMDTKAWTL